MTFATSDSGLNGNPGPDGERDGRPFGGDSAHHLVTRDERIDHVAGVALPHLDVGA
jgi:hypothetical protein